MPPHDIMQGMPMAIIALIAFMRSAIMPIADGSIGIMRMVIPSFVISHDIRHIIGIAIIGIMPGMPIIPGIMPPIIPGMPPIIPGIIPPGIIPPPIMPGIIPPIMGMPMPPIGMGMGIIIGIPPDGMPPIIGMPIDGIALIGVIRSSSCPQWRFGRNDSVLRREARGAYPGVNASAFVHRDGWAVARAGGIIR
jgi:hypothetical protein